MRLDHSSGWGPAASRQAGPDALQRQEGKLFFFNFQKKHYTSVPLPCQQPPTSPRWKSSGGRAERRNPGPASCARRHPPHSPEAAPRAIRQRMRSSENDSSRQAPRRGAQARCGGGER